MRKSAAVPAQPSASLWAWALLAACSAFALAAAALVGFA